MEELCDFYEPTAATKGVVIRTYLAPDLPSTAIDADLLKQALLNLILNAEHAMPSGGELILKTRSDRSSVVLDVIDTGVGMTEEVRAQIFRRLLFHATGRERTGFADRPQDRRVSWWNFDGAERAWQGITVYRTASHERRGSPERRAVFLGGFPKRAALKREPSFSHQSNQSTASEQLADGPADPRLGGRRR